MLDDFLHRGIILDQQRPFRGLRGGSASATGSCSLSGPLAARQVHGHGGAIAELAGDRHRAARLAGQAVNLRQPQSGPFVQMLGREKRLENLWQDSAAMPQPVSVTVKATNSPRRRSGVSSGCSRTFLAVIYDRPAVGHRVPGIDDQVYQRELQFMNIDSDRPNVCARYRSPARYLRGRNWQADRGTLRGAGAS